MQFELSPDQLAIRELARSFCEREIVPHAAGWDRLEEVDREMQTVADLSLVLGVLSAEPKYTNTEGVQFHMVVAKVAGLGRASARAGDRIPAVRQWNSRPPCHRINVDREPSS